MTWVPVFPRSGWFGARFLRFVRRIKLKVSHVDTS
jgi:aspartate aminotransferase-like enzyme